MDLGIKDKKVLLTGASRGLGAQMAREFVQEGCEAFVVARKKEDVADLAEELGERARGMSLDLSEPDAGPVLIQSLHDQGFDPEIVVHNLGGTLDVTDPFCTMEMWRKVQRINLEVQVELNQVFIPRMRKKGWGRILHTSSIAALENQGPVPYCAAKAGLCAYVRSMGRIVAPHNIVMTALLPGAVFTENGYWDLASKNRPEHVKKYLEERMAIKRFGTVDEISGVALFLCSQRSSFFVGSNILVDGGQGRVFNHE